MYYFWVGVGGSIVELYSGKSFQWGSCGKVFNGAAAEKFLAVQVLVGWRRLEKVLLGRLIKNIFFMYFNAAEGLSTVLSSMPGIVVEYMLVDGFINMLSSIPGIVVEYMLVDGFINRLSSIPSIVVEYMLVDGFINMLSSIPGTVVEYMLVDGYINMLSSIPGNNRLG